LPEKVAQENFATFDYNLSPNFNDNFFGLPDYSGIDYGSADYNTDVVEATTPTKIHNNVYSDVYN
jgi:hypothetical protein